MNNTNSEEQKRKEILQRIRSMSLLEDNFMTKCFEDNYEAVELVLRIVLDKPDIKVEKVITQYNMKNIKGHSLRLDIYATDSSGKKYNVEIQRADKGAGAKRARYHSSLIDSNILLTGFEFEKLADTYVIFITENDVIGRNKPIYHIDRYVRETEEYFNDGSHIIYVNASYKDDTDLGKLMHDFCCINPDDMNYKILSTTVKYYKEDKEGLYVMGRVMEEMINDEKKNSALLMLEDGDLSFDKIARYTGLSIEEIEELAKELQLA